MLGDRKRARKAFANCRPLGGHVQPIERQGKIAFFKPKQKIKNKAGNEIDVGGNGF